jgi:hypothetical protein
MHMLRKLTISLTLCALLSHAQAQSNAELIFRDGFEVPRWVNVTGPSFWQCSANCSLVNGQFVEAGAGMTLTAVGTWAAGLRPIAVRVNASAYGNGQLFELAVGLLPGGNDFGSCSNYVVNTSCALTVSSDIQRINLYISERINSIEFLLP